MCFGRVQNSHYNSSDNTTGNSSLPYLSSQDSKAFRGLSLGCSRVLLGNIYISGIKYKLKKILLHAQDEQGQQQKMQNSFRASRHFT